MTDQEREIALKIVRELDRSPIDRTVAAQLSAAREQALARYQPAPALGLAVAGYAATQLFERQSAALRYVISLMVLILGLAGVVYWQSGGNGNEIADIDAHLLTDDLPIDAYLDKGFDSWLKRQSR